MMENALLHSAERSPFNGRLLFFVKNKTFLCLWSRLNHLQLPAPGCTWGPGCSAEEPCCQPFEDWCSAVKLLVFLVSPGVSHVVQSLWLFSKPSPVYQRPPRYRAGRKGPSFLVRYCPCHIQGLLLLQCPSLIKAESHFNHHFVQMSYVQLFSHHVPQVHLGVILGYSSQHKSLQLSSS